MQAKLAVQSLRPKEPRTENLRSPAPATSVVCPSHWQRREGFSFWGALIQARLRGSQPRFTTHWISILTPHHQNSDGVPFLAVNHRKGKVMQQMNSPDLIARRTKAGEFDEQCQNAGVLVEKANRKFGPACLPVNASRFEKVKLCAAMQVVVHATAALARARASGPETSSDGSASASASASRWAARAAHFASLNLSESRPPMT